MSILNGLEAGANFASGFQTGQRQRLVDNMNQLAFQNAQLKEQQDQLNAKRAQAESDYLISSFNSQIKNPANGQPVGGQPGNDMSPEQQTMSRLSGMATAAGRAGDTAGYGQAVTEQANYQIAMQQQQVRQAQLQEAAIKQHSQLAAAGGNLAANFPDTPQGFQQWKAAYFAQYPNMPPDMRQNVSQMQYHPKMMGPNGTLAQHAFTAVQRNNATLAQQKMANEQNYRAQQQAAEARRAAETHRHNIAMETAKKNGGNTVQKEATGQQLDQAMQALSQYGSSVTPGSSGNHWTPSMPDASYETLSQQLAASALQYAKQNNIPYEVALPRVLQMYKDSGKIAQNPPSYTFWTGEKEAPTYKVDANLGTTPQNPIPYKSSEDAINGNYYSNHGSIFLRTNGKWYGPIK